MNAVFDNFSGGEKPVINQCLINRYVGPESFLTEHSDDENSIDPESLIYTVSLGDQRSVKFTNKLSGDNHVEVCESRSFYSMSRHSQNLWRHGIEKDSKFGGSQYSLTFRHVGPQFKHSIIIFGDSNASKYKFGTDRGTFGISTPGKKFYTPKVEDINPCEGISLLIV